VEIHPSGTIAKNSDNRAGAKLNPYSGKQGLIIRFPGNAAVEVYPDTDRQTLEGAGSNGEPDMIVDLNRVRIFVRPGVTDMGKQINGPAIIAEARENDRDQVLMLLREIDFWCGHREQIRIMKAREFGRKSEKRSIADIKQGKLFDEAELR
jgi:hypothetical protein